MPQPCPRFDLLKSPLDGTNLIEASAGTGKTYAIAGLFLRLLLEKHMAPSEILVMTYTVAATEELRDRIRGKIRAALDALSGNGAKDRVPRGSRGRACRPEGCAGPAAGGIEEFRRGPHLHDPLLLPEDALRERLREREPLRHGTSAR